MKIIFDRENCIGCGSCIAACPDNWEMGDDGKANLKNSEEEDGKKVLEIDEEGCNGQARDLCPVQVIKITD
ncbi:MAG: ferredoxin [Patescibacteria group bacterium]